LQAAGISNRAANAAPQRWLPISDLLNNLPASRIAAPMLQIQAASLGHSE
jgi:hypothetical protein